ncbi:alpha/beta hydrolase-fold protein [Companilactobacillus ginsenosidimutans]|uniref:carboxylesterase family protein n=1 Tax=Companilactobacillus ginsenosidimutans TaxID=1007676 RepID=UPI00066160B1|nr:alpha/beta hydrolase-fold protein [Companilactobacillus ginsenosidimutans]
MKKKKTLLLFVLLAMFAIIGTACSSSSSSSDSKDSSSFKKTDTNDPKADPSLSKVTKEVKSEFKQLSYKDKKTGVTLRYNLYVPKNYDKNKSYPMMTFIPDDSVTGQSTIKGVTQGYGGSIWATKAEQKKHASFVLIPVFDSSTVSGGMGEYGSAVVKKNVQTYLDLLNKIEGQYSINKDRLYGTGQSMGGMTMFYLNSHYPKLFAATLYTSSQWEVSQLEKLKNQKFFYFAGGGDSNASKGQKDLKKMLKKDGKSYSSTTLDAKISAKAKNTAANKLIDKNNNANFITWKTGTVLDDSGQGMEHMASFDYGYTVPAVRDWVYNQSK